MKRDKDTRAIVQRLKSKRGVVTFNHRGELVDTVTGKPVGIAA